MSPSRAVNIVLAFLACGAACSADGTSATLPEPHSDDFARDVYPVLLRDCGSPACHGARERFFHIVGPGRTRLTAAQAPLDPATTQEILESYRRTRAMLESDTGSPPLLLRKPLELTAGGASHGGRDAYGHNVYASKDDARYRTLERWAAGEPTRGEP